RAIRARRASSDRPSCMAATTSAGRIGAAGSIAALAETTDGDRGGGSVSNPNVSKPTSPKPAIQATPDATFAPLDGLTVVASIGRWTGLLQSWRGSWSQWADQALSGRGAAHSNRRPHVSMSGLLISFRIADEID